MTADTDLYRALYAERWGIPPERERPGDEDMQALNAALEATEGERKKRQRSRRTLP